MVPNFSIASGTLVWKWPLNGMGKLLIVMFVGRLSSENIALHKDIEQL